MPNYFNSLSLRDQLAQLGKCEFMDLSEFADEANALLKDRPGDVEAVI